MPKAADRDEVPGHLPSNAAPTPGAGHETSLRELAGLFLRLGATSFGGPAAHTALMREEVVRRRHWLDDAGFLDLVGATQLIPGPNSTELAIHLGWQRRRGLGLVVSGVSFIVPGMIATWALAMAYVRFGTLPEVAAFFYGLKPVVVALVVNALLGLAPIALRTPRLAVIGVAALGLAALGVHELVVLLAAGVAALGMRARAGAAPPFALAAGAAATPALALGAQAPGAVPIFLVFAKIGSVLFGSGYVLLAFLRSEFVTRLGWLDEATLLDAVAVGQMTPGPVFTTATFAGYLMGGHAGALAATAGIFLPAFVFVALSIPILRRLRASEPARALLDGVNAASLALMALVAFHLARSGAAEIPTAILALAALAALRWTKWNPTWLVFGGASLGWTLHAAGIAG